MSTDLFRLTVDMVGLRALSDRVDVLNEDPWIVREEISYIEGSIRKELDRMNYRYNQLLLVKVEIDKIKTKHIRGYHNVH